MNLEQLLHKYFEGETTCEEEKELRRLFRSSNVPEEFKAYSPLFAYMEQENRKHKRALKTIYTKYILYAACGVAASLVILVTGNSIYKAIYAKPDNYVIIDGKRYTDTGLIREHAQIAFSDVSFSQEEIFDTLFD